MAWWTSADLQKICRKCRNSRARRLQRMHCSGKADQIPLRKDAAISLERLGGAARHQIAHQQMRDLADEAVAVAVERSGLVDDELMGQRFHRGHENGGRG